MSVRLLVACVALAACPNILLAQQLSFPIKSGDQVTVRMTGDLGRKFVELQEGQFKDFGKTKDDFVLTSGRILDIDEGRIKFSISTPFKGTGNSDRLLNLIATVDAQNLKARFVPKNSSPFGPARTVSITPASGGKTITIAPTAEDQCVPELHADQLKDLKFSVWALSNEESF